MSLTVIKLFLIRLFGNRYTWYSIATGAALYGAAHWHDARVDGAVERTTTMLTAEFEAQKKQAIKDEQTRSQQIIDQLRSDYEQQLSSASTRAQNLIDSHRTGAVRLSVPAACTSPIISGNGGRAESNPERMATESRAELSDSAVEFFASEAERADKQAVQLNVLIDVVERLRTGVAP